MEKGRKNCSESPTLREEYIKETLGKCICENGIYDEEIVRDRVDEILVFNKYIDVCCRNGDRIKSEF